MKRRSKRKTAGILAASIILSICMVACSEKDEVVGQINMESMQAQTESETSGKNMTTEGNSSMDEGTEKQAEGLIDLESEAEKSSEGEFYDGANLSGRVVEFSDEGFQITPSTLIVNEDGSMEGGIAAPGYESEEDNITITYQEDTEFQIVYFSMASQTEVSREDTDKSSIRKETNVDIFGTCQEDKHWIADKVVITRWQ